MSISSSPAAQRKSISQKQLLANRANAKKSTGPRTPEGKRRVSQNALTHGHNAKSLPDSHFLAQAHQYLLTDRALDLRKAEFLKHYQPNTPVEHDLVDELTHLSARLQLYRFAEFRVLNTPLGQLTPAPIVDENAPRATPLGPPHAQPPSPARANHPISATTLTRVGEGGGEGSHDPLDTPITPTNTSSSKTINTGFPPSAALGSGQGEGLPLEVERWKLNVESSASPPTNTNPSNPTTPTPSPARANNDISPTNSSRVGEASGCLDDCPRAGGGEGSHDPLDPPVPPTNTSTSNTTKPSEPITENYELRTENLEPDPDLPPPYPKPTFLLPHPPTHLDAIAATSPLAQVAALHLLQDHPTPLTKTWDYQRRAEARYRAILRELRLLQKENQDRGQQLKKDVTALHEKYYQNHYANLAQRRAHVSEHANPTPTPLPTPPPRVAAAPQVPCPPAPTTPQHTPPRVAGNVPAPTEPPSPTNPTPSQQPDLPIGNRQSAIGNSSPTSNDSTSQIKPISPPATPPKTPFPHNSAQIKPILPLPLLLPLLLISPPNTTARCDLQPQQSTIHTQPPVRNTLLILLLSLPTHAQIVTDGKLGPKTSLTGPDITIDAALGRRAGPNLFHSFNQFNVNTNQSVTFAAPAPVSRILVRVTGNQSTLVQGLLRCPVDLYLMNPNGITFGQGATLDVAGAFVVTTAGTIRLQDNSEFRAAPAKNETLTSAPPVAFGFLNTKSNPITATGDPNVPVTLAAPFAKRLTLVANGIRIENARLQAKAGRIELVSAGQGSTVELEHQSGPKVTGPLADLSLSSDSEIDGDLAGRIFLRAANLSLSRAAIHSRTDEPAGGGLIDIGATANVTLDQSASINANTLGAGPAATVNLRASSLRLTNLSVISSDSGDSQHAASGRGGNITLSTATLRIDRASTIQSFVWGSGDGGNIHVSASRSLVIDGLNSLGTGIASESRTKTTTGNGGTITIHAGDISLLDTAQITSTTRGLGNAGDLAITARNLTLDGHGLPTEPTLVQSRSGTAATGNGAKLTIDVTDTITLNGGGVISASTFGHGNGGNVAISTGTLVARHAPASQFTGVFARSAAITGSPVSDFGQAGSLDIRAKESILLRDGAQISTLAQQSNGGSITLLAGNGVDLTAGSSITAQAGLDNRHHPLAVDGGNLTLTASNYLHLDHSTLSAKADRNGGTLFIDPKVVALSQSQLLANAISGFGGSIDLFATDGLFNDRSTFNVSSRLGVAFSGSVNVFTPDIDLGATLAKLPGALATPDMRLRDLCRPGQSTTSTFLIQSRGALSIEPTGPSPSLDFP